MSGSNLPELAAPYSFSAAICSGTGEMIAQGPCLAVHLGSIPDAMEAVQQKFGGRMEPGDVYMLNDPYTGSTANYKALINLSHLEGFRMGMTFKF